jgi:HSP20 family protein
MISRLDDFERTFAAMHHLRHRVDRVFDELDTGRTRSREAERLWSARYPRLAFTDTGASLVLEADLPGIGDKDVQLTFHQDVLTVSGARRQDVPEGWLVHRQERAPLKFSQSFTLPVKIDPEKSSATVKNGVLTVTLAKAAEAQPRPISVTAQ